MLSGRGKTESIMILRKAKEVLRIEAKAIEDLAKRLDKNFPILIIFPIISPRYL